MRNRATVFVLIVLVAAGAALAWSIGESNGDAQDPVTLTGCLRTGSAETVFVLRGAAAGETTDAPDQATPRDYLLVAIADGVDLNAHLNHRVAITGISSQAANGPAPPEAANAAERAMPRLAVRELRHVAPNCSVPQ